jgi:hypothetical protein
MKPIALGIDDGDLILACWKFLISNAELKRNVGDQLRADGLGLGRPQLGSQAERSSRTL